MPPAWIGSIPPHGNCWGSASGTPASGCDGVLVGRGVLRTAVDRHLRDHPQVASRRTGAVGEGGRGVTVVRLR